MSSRGIGARGGWPTVRFGAALLVWICALVLVGQAAAGTITGQVITKKEKYRKGAVVYVDSIAGRTFEPPEEHVVMNQEGLEFIPRVLPIVTGTTVDFRNSDNVMHNVFTPDEAGDKFNLGSWPQGEIRSHTFTKSCETACDAVMLCNVHPEMEAFIVILDNPYFCVTDEKGAFTISDLPAGKYRLRTWHERFDETSVEVTVTGGETVTVELSLQR